MTVTKNTVVSMSLAGLLTFAGGMWATVSKVQAGFTQISMNTAAIQGVVKSMELSRIDRIIEGKQKEIRDKEIAVLEADGNEPLLRLLQDQISQLQDEIDLQMAIRACVVDPEKKVCK